MQQKNSSDYENIYRNTQNSARYLPFLYSIAKPLYQDPTDNLELPRWHEQVEIKLFLKGKAEIICGPKIFIAEEGDIVLINSGELHGIRQYGDTEPVYHLLMISLEQLVNTYCCRELVMVQEGKTAFHNLIRGSEELKHAFMRLFEELDAQRPAYEMAAMGHLYVLLTLLMREQAKENQPIMPENRKYIEKIQPAIAYMQQYYKQEIRVETLAAACSLSPFHFSRLFKKVTGYTPVSYLNQFRIHKAAALLENDTVSITDIAYAVGYEDEAYFSRCFKNYMHVSPSRYRENRKDAEKRAR